MGKKLSVTIVTGGRSSERDISLVTAAGVLDHLDRDKYRPSVVDSADAAALSNLAQNRPDVAFIAQHGAGGEDGAVQGFLQTLGVPYTGSGILASALALDKTRCKQFLMARGARFPASVLVVRGETCDSGEPPMPPPFVVKPNASGSSDGLTIVHDLRQTDYRAALDFALRFDDCAMIEEYVAGMEITVGVLGAKQAQALPVIEICPAKGVYDREAKYTPGATEKVCPARLSASVAAAAQDLALTCHRELGCRGMSRTDMIVTAQNCVVAIEVNTIPGMTPTSLLPRAAQQAGISYTAMLDTLIACALEDANRI